MFIWVYGISCRRLKSQHVVAPDRWVVEGQRMYWKPDWYSNTPGCKGRIGLWRIHLSSWLWPQGQEFPWRFHPEGAVIAERSTAFHCTLAMLPNNSCGKTSKYNISNRCWLVIHLFTCLLFVSVCLHYRLCPLGVTRGHRQVQLSQ